MRALVHPDGRFVLAGRIVRVAIGRGGVTVRKQEGDGATPLGTLPLRRVLYRADRLRAPSCAVAVEPIAPDDGWCDDPDRPEYNRAVRLPYPGRHEALWRDDRVYDVIGVLGWNDAPVRRGDGSAIFLHAARPDWAPTEGCVGLSLPDLLASLAAGLTEIEVCST